jgi:hypothetical protein
MDGGRMDGGSGGRTIADDGRMTAGKRTMNDGGPTDDGRTTNSARTTTKDGGPVTEQTTADARTRNEL